MNRQVVFYAVVTLAAAASGCSNPVCGLGTKEHQKTNGDIECLPADAGPDAIVCDVDAGATIVAGKCVSAVSCGPNTKLMNGECVGTGGMGASHVPDPCTTPGTGKICVNGVVRHLVDNSFLAAGETVQVWVVDPLRFLNAPTALTSTQCPGPQNPCLGPPANVTDTYTFLDLPTPGTGIAAVAVGDTAGVNPPVLQLTGTGVIVVSGQSYQVDSYATPKSLVATWTSQNPGTDYDAQGAYLVKYFLDPAPLGTLLTATETMPAMGVQVVQDGLVSTRTKYFSTDLMTLGADPSTTTVGAGILTGNGNISVIPIFSGLGNTPGTKWETHQGNSTGHVVFVDRFHPCTQDANGTCTN
jgi:hypothetical protein